MTNIFVQNDLKFQRLHKFNLILKKKKYKKYIFSEKKYQFFKGIGKFQAITSKCEKGHELLSKMKKNGDHILSHKKNNRSQKRKNNDNAHKVYR